MLSAFLLLTVSSVPRLSTDDDTPSGGNRRIDCEDVDPPQRVRGTGNGDSLQLSNAGVDDGPGRNGGIVAVNCTIHEDDSCTDETTRKKVTTAAVGHIAEDGRLTK